MRPHQGFFRRVSMAVVLLHATMMASAASLDDEFRMPIADAFKITGKGVVLTGRVSGGTAEVGDWVCVPMQNGQLLGRQIIGLELFRKLLERIEQGQNVGVLIEDLEYRQIAKGSDLVAGCSDSVEDTDV